MSAVVTLTISFESNYYRIEINDPQHAYLRIMKFESNYYRIEI